MEFRNRRNELERTFDLDFVWPMLSHTREEVDEPLTSDVVRQELL